jgi:hypothetical protein
MKYTVSGTDHESGAFIELTVEAADIQSAAAIATRKGVDVAGVRVASSPNSPPSSAASPSILIQKKRRMRVWLTFALLIAGIMAPFVPAVPLWAGLVIAGLVLLYLVMPPARRPVGAFLRVSPERPAWRAIKLTGFVLVGILLIGVSFTGKESVRQRAEFAAKQEVERQAKAQAQAEATAKVSGLVVSARAALTEGEISKAESLLDEASKVAEASNRGTARALSDKIRNSADSGWILMSLVGAPENEFARFRGGGAPPSSLDFGFAALTNRAVALARPQVDAAVIHREEAKRQAEAASEAARKAREERVAAERKVAEQRAADEEAAKEATQREVKDRLDSYMAVLNAADVKLVDSVSVRRIGNKTWEATLTVRDIWHLRHYQLRLQDAQTLWEAWAVIASHSEPDLARIKLVDGNGNEVGGSRMWGGSLIWVQND